jgi:hypothetical protein
MIVNPFKPYTTSLIIVVLMLFVIHLLLQYSSEVNWTLLDYAVAGVFLLISSFGITFILQNKSSVISKSVVVSSVLLILILVWIELAVGIFGTAIAGQ